MAEQVEINQLIDIEDGLRETGHKEEAELLGRAIEELKTLRIQVEKLQSELED